MSSKNTPRWLLAIIAAAAVKIAVGLAGLVSHSWVAGTDDGRTLLLIANLVLFSAVAIVLLVASRGDRRAGYLGALFLCAASTAASTGLTPPEVRSLAWLGGVPALLNGLNPDAFFPLLCWMFFREFPRGRVRGLAHPAPVRFAVRTAAIAGFGLFVASALAAIPQSVWQRNVLGPGFPLLFWAVVGALSLPPLGYSLWRMRAADVVERRRISLFMAGFVAGAGPVFVIFVLGVISPRLGRIITDPHDAWYLSPILMSLPLLIPLATVYAVLVQDVLDVRLVVRKAIRYSLARFTVLAVTVVPFFVCAVHLFLNRNHPLVEIMTSRQVLPLALLGGLGAFLLATRRRILLSVDRHFFREQYDAYTILQAVVDNSRFVTSKSGLAVLLREQVDRALHVERAAVLVLDRENGFFISPDRSARKLPLSWQLVQMLALGPQALEVDLENPRSPLQRLPDVERQWLADGGFTLVVPIVSGVGSLVGILALGPKRSELPFSREDCELLVAASASAAVALERVLMSASESGDAGGRFLLPEDATISSGELAGECVVCGVVHAHVGSACAACGRALRAAVLPKLSQGKYRLERRIGAGGMGVVYLAKDVELARQVAIKTLPRLSPERSVRLRREARAMASVTHPNVAMIYSVEAWQGVPLLILEYLPGGTVRERLARACFSPHEVVELGIALSGALEAAHASGVLHRDIKPSNVGFGKDGAAKLMDFGLARVLADLELGDERPLDAMSSVPTLNQSWTGPDRVVGTPAYLSPEAAIGQQPEPSFDLWGLAVLLLEALIGRNPLRGSTVEVTLLKVSEARLQPVEEMMPACPPALAGFLDECLARDPGRRPRNAKVMRQRLEVVRSLVGA